MRRGTANQSFERAELRHNFLTERVGVVGRHPFVARDPASVSVLPLRDVDMQTYGESGMLTRELCRRVDVLAVNHEAGAGNDAVLMSQGYSPVHSRTRAEVVGIDDEVAGA